jgi:C-terminal processing protease CtpA/Prc
MRRALLFLVTAALVVVGCSVVGPAGNATEAPTKTPDIKRSTLDIAYSAFVDQDVHHVTSKKALEAALEAARVEARAQGGNADVRTPSFQDSDETQLNDFKAFADAVNQLALGVQAAGRSYSAERLADATISGMIKASPDCHTQYLSASGRVLNSSPAAITGADAMIPAEGTSLGGPDEAGLTGKILPGGIAYITWHDFAFRGTYKIDAAVRAMLTKAVAQGAKAWLIDLRGNLGGSAVDMTSMFLNGGEPTLTIVGKTGNGGTATANKDLRLPAQYQLPMAVIINGKSASGSEVFALGLKENKRATIVGQKSLGCLGAESPSPLPGGASIHVAVQEFVGGVTGAKYNNAGIPPDVQVDDASAVAKAIGILQQKIGGG